MQRTDNMKPETPRMEARPRRKGSKLAPPFVLPFQLAAHFLFLQGLPLQQKHKRYL